jgi:hypothetical protein
LLSAGDKENGKPPFYPVRTNLMHLAGGTLVKIAETRLGKHRPHRLAGKTKVIHTGIVPMKKAVIRIKIGNGEDAAGVQGTMQLPK